MPRTDGWLTSRDICNQAVIERILQDESVTSLKISATIQSDNFSSGSAGWQIRRDTGSAEFQNVTVRGSLNADDLTAGTLSVDRIAASSVARGKLIIGSVDNLVQNPGFEADSIDGDNDPHDYSDTGSGGTWSSATGNPRSGGRAARFDVDTQSALADLAFNGDPTGPGNHPACGEGDTFYLEVYGRTIGTGTHPDFQAAIGFYDEAGVLLEQTNGTAVTPSSTYQRAVHRRGAPAGSAYVVFFARVRTGGDSTAALLFDDAYARRAVGSVIFEADLQSDNFSAGSAGWQIQRDTGSAEFNNVTVRGDIESSNFSSGSAGYKLTASTGDIEISGDLDITNAGSLFCTPDAGSWTGPFFVTATQGTFTFTGDARGIYGNADGIVLDSNGGNIVLDALIGGVDLGGSSLLNSVIVNADGQTIKTDTGGTDVYRTTSSAGDGVFAVRSDVSGTDTQHALIYADGDVENTNNSYGGISDERLKKNIRTARSYLDDLRKVRITTHALKATNKNLLGPIAQELQPIFPGMVRENENGYLAVKHSVFVPMLITAVQELANRVEALEA